MTPATRTELDELILASTPGNFPWDKWQTRALTAGLAAELAGLGRFLMREAYQHDWCEVLKQECGLLSDSVAQGMIDCALQEPELTADRWQWLLATDGLRFDPWQHDERSEDSMAWTEMRQRWEAENVPAGINETLEMKREAIRFIEDFYLMNQLLVVDLMNHAISIRSKERVLWADFTVIEHDPVNPRIRHSGVVRIERHGESVDVAIFKQEEE